MFLGLEVGNLVQKSKWSKTAFVEPGFLSINVEKRSQIPSKQVKSAGRTADVT